MSELTISVAHNNARLAASIVYADTGTPNSRIRLYNAADVLLATVVLDKPCGSVVADKLVLVQEDPTADLVVTSGDAHHAEWLNGAGNLVASGMVTFDGDTDPVTSLYPFKVAGSSSTTLYAGGLVVLGTTSLE